MRRYAVVQKARDADVFGILVGTLGVALYLPLISHIRNLLSQARKKSYTISVGKLNPSKLANFMEIECFVLVACPENSLVEAKVFKLLITFFSAAAWRFEFRKGVSEADRHTLWARGCTEDRAKFGQDVDTFLILSNCFLNIVHPIRPVCTSFWSSGAGVDCH